MPVITVDLLYNRLPSLYRAKDAELGLPLKRFITSLVNGGFVLVEQDIANYHNLFNPDKCPVEFLPLLAGLLGFEFPFDMPESVQRKFVKYLAKLYQTKGTKNSLQYMLSQVLGFTATITDEDTTNKTFVVDLTASGNDPQLVNKQRKARQLLDVYSPLGTRYSILSGYAYQGSISLNLSVYGSSEAYRVRLNRSKGFVLNSTSHSPLNTKDIVREEVI